MNNFFNRQKISGHEFSKRIDQKIITEKVVSIVVSFKKNSIKRWFWVKILLILTNNHVKTQTPRMLWVSHQNYSQFEFYFFQYLFSPVTFFSSYLPLLKVFKAFFSSSSFSKGNCTSPYFLPQTSLTGA